MQIAPFGYKLGYNDNLERFEYFPDEESCYFIVSIFSAVSKFHCIDKLVNNLNEVELKTPNGLPFTRIFITEFISNPFYINLLEREMDGSKRYIVDVFESLISVEAWIFAQIAIENWDVLKHPDIRSHISNHFYYRETLSITNLFDKKLRNIL